MYSVCVDITQSRTRKKFSFSFFFHHVLSWNIWLNFVRMTVYLCNVINKGWIKGINHFSKVGERNVWVILRQMGKRYEKSVSPSVSSIWLVTLPEMNLHQGISFKMKNWPQVNISFEEIILLLIGDGNNL